MTDSQANTPLGGDPATTEAAASRAPVAPAAAAAGRAQFARRRRTAADARRRRSSGSARPCRPACAGSPATAFPSSIDPPASLRMGEYLMLLSPALPCACARLEGTNAPGLVVAGADLVFSAR